MPRGPPVAQDSTSEFVPVLLARLEELLGPTWRRIRGVDRHGLVARPPNPVRHPLALLVEHAPLAALNMARGEFPGYVPDLLALTTGVELLAGARDEVSFPEIVSGMVRPEGSRHNMLVLGMVDLLRRYTAYDVELFRSRATTGRVIDFDFGQRPGPRLAVETKGPQEFDGPTRDVSAAVATRAIGKHNREPEGAASRPRPPSL